MKSILIAAASLAFLLSSSHLAAAQDLAAQLIGVWKGKGFAEKILATGETTKPRGESPTGTATFSRGGHFTWIIINDGRKVPASPATDADRVALFNSLAFGTGTYKVEGDKVALRYDGSWNQAWTGTERIQTLQISGEVLTWTSAPFKMADGKEAVAIFTYERVE
jgi:Lipocalin-like domain